MIACGARSSSPPLQAHKDRSIGTNIIAVYLMVTSTRESLAHASNACASPKVARGFSNTGGIWYDS